MPKSKKKTQWEIERESHEKPILIPLTTRVPNKYRICDLENNTVWKWDEKRQEFVISELPSVFPNFGDKANIMDKAREFTIAVEALFVEYNRCFKYDHDQPVDLIKLGEDVIKALDKCYTALVLWKIEINAWYHGKAVEHFVNGMEGKNEQP